jgi:hypothetical protein
MLINDLFSISSDDDSYEDPVGVSMNVSSGYLSSNPNAELVTENNKISCQQTEMLSSKS